MFEQTHNLIQLIKTSNPLVLHLTNYVTMEWIANGLLSFGASPVMTESIHEIDDLVQIANSLVINIGTLGDDFLARCEAACKTANHLGKPIVFDPVGCGATPYRTRTCLNFLDRFQFTVIRGNASEIMALAGHHTQTKGVDSLHMTDEAIESALNLSSRYQTTVAISGKTDYIITNQTIQKIERGSSMMTKITGSGCLLASVVAAANAVCNCAASATTSALLFYSICGEIAAQKSTGPGSFHTHFLDTLSCLPMRHDYE